jgi:mRNA interferase MazF
VKRGEIRWYTFRLPDKRRPVLILTRNEIIDRLNEIIVVPATRTIRGLTTEVATLRWGQACDFAILVL